MDELRAAEEVLATVSGPAPAAEGPAAATGDVFAAEGPVSADGDGDGGRRRRLLKLSAFMQNFM
eukprot:8361177-Pyramimonas_sp.AAC.2